MNNLILTRNQLSERNNFLDKKLIIPVILYIIFLSPLVLTPELDILEQPDEETYHYPMVVNFVEQFPFFDIINYKNSMTPFYHIFLSLFGVTISENLFFLRFVNLGISLICLWVLFHLYSRQRDIQKAAFFTFLVFLSPYFFGAAIRITTDNAALLLIFLVILSILQPTGIPKIKNRILTNTLIFAAVVTRQVNAWLLGVYFFFSVITDFKEKKPIGDAVKNLLPLILPFSGLLLFLVLWKGLTPPNADHVPGVNRMVNLEGFIYIISLFGLFGSFFVTWINKIRIKIGKFSLIKVISVIVISSIILFLIYPVSNEYTLGQGGARGGALWYIISKFPMVFNNSLVLWSLFPLGLLYLVLFIKYFLLNKNLLKLLIIVFWIIATSMNPATYQRYYEPFILFFLGFSLIDLEIDKKYDWAGPVFLMIILIATDFLRFYLPLIRQ